ncbi:dethiobiotin synthetase [Stackebrandtia endophytica]|uniref:ATP-dependent dethiobiotin synthetase BioD n=1 Tax=Stackebrandtia endophytica TaxID=1496996 RepID=A0A543B2A6_9ACTN|nr:dethiobiotin synthase [Stackebrandtia endophytica]TQL78936.1 dethiobiotin synthetase [Stackebrandtia endophytica]
MTDAILGPVIVTGTDTGVGKTITTAAIAASAKAAGVTVAVVKPVQTGDDDDAAVIRRLADPDLVTTVARFDHPMAPLAAAREAGRAPVSLPKLLTVIDRLDHELVLIEGAGGLLVPMGDAGWTIADLARQLGAVAVVVTRGDLGTLNHTALTLEALRRRAIPTRVVIGAFPTVPERGRLERANFVDLTVQSGQLAGVLPPGAGRLSPDGFAEAAPFWLTRPLHGRLSTVV